MPRANRYFLPGYVWHLTQRCHRRAFLLKCAKDRRTWLRWLFEAKKRYGLCVLNYIVTSNHIHLLVQDTGPHVIAHSLQLVAGRTAQAYNQRKRRNGAFWEDRYHATAVQTDRALVRCVTYIDLNMVRAGVVSHPSQWAASGYSELQALPQRYRIVNVPVLMALLGFDDVTSMQTARARWVNDRSQPCGQRDASWTESLAVGAQAFVEEIKARLAGRARGRAVTSQYDGFVLKEPSACYQPRSDTKTGAIRAARVDFSRKNG